jgi:hypothetical protein
MKTKELIKMDEKKAINKIANEKGLKNEQAKKIYDEEIHFHNGLSRFWRVFFRFDHIIILHSKERNEIFTIDEDNNVKFMDELNNLPTYYNCIKGINRGKTVVGTRADVIEKIKDGKISNKHQAPPTKYY